MSLIVVVAIVGIVAHKPLRAGATVLATEVALATMLAHSACMQPVGNGAEALNTRELSKVQKHFTAGVVERPTINAKKIAALHLHYAEQHGMQQLRAEAVAAANEVAADAATKDIDANLEVRRLAE